MQEFKVRLSKTGKMPCASFSLPAKACKTGSKLTKCAGSVCSGCYAKKGNYTFPAVQQARQANLDSLPVGNDWTAWQDKMIDVIRSQDSTGYFRWHDSGDIQSIRHLEALCYIAYRMPDVSFWLPTQEQGMLSRYLQQGGIIPDNLVVRVSSAMIDQAPNAKFSHTGTVHKNNAPIGYECKAASQGGACMRCRACWDKAVPNVSYPKH